MPLPSTSHTRALSAAAGSWLTLLAVTTLGDAAGALRAEVRAEGLSGGAIYRLVVQSYDTAPGRVPGHDARPVGSVQRAVTGEELRQGVNVSLVEIRGTGLVEPARSPLVVAWIEVGEPNLEFDGRTARPGAGSVYGIAKRAVTQGTVQISLNRRLAEQST